MLKDDSMNDTQYRLIIIGAFVDLMVYDLAGKASGVDEFDFEECLGDYMLRTYNVEGDDESIE